MALSKTIEDPRTGAIATYWRISRMEMDASSQTMTLHLAGYASEDVRRREGSMPLQVRRFYVSGDAFTRVADTPVESETPLSGYDALATSAYTHIKTDFVKDADGNLVAGSDEFADAEDV